MTLHNHFAELKVLMTLHEENEEEPLTQDEIQVIRSVLDMTHQVCMGPGRRLAAHDLLAERRDRLRSRDKYFFPIHNRSADWLRILTKLFTFQ
jgi:hypothetical protein